jgi:predicted O-linked N-acetylglucosamine transferase (SPINDLY family)
LEPAIADLEAAMRLVPEIPYLRGNLLHARMTAGDWRDFENDKQALDEAVRAGKHAVEPFAYQALSDSPQDLQACARLFAGRNFPPAAPIYKVTQRKHGPIRVGYVCGEFRQQATMILAAGLFEAHDRERFEILAFDNGHSDDSAMRRRLEAAFARIIPIARLPDAAAAQCVADAGIDILVNLNGYFGALRMGLFAQRPAPIQVNYLGFPGTLGAPYMDYILADACVLPEGDVLYYDEKIVRLPGSYQINDDKRARPIAIASRNTHSLPDTGFVFCNFNFAYKITPALFACWMRLLHAVPGSVLWLLHDNEIFAANLRRAAAEQGIDAARLIFAPIAPPDEHVARLTLADLVLDSLPYNAHTTASDALWAGVPVLTCRGNAFAGRVGASLLQAAGLSELVTETLDAYEALAVSLARAPERLSALRRQLANDRPPLFDTARTTRHIESAYAEMLARHTRGEAPADFSI